MHCHYFKGYGKNDFLISNKVKYNGNLCTFKLFHYYIGGKRLIIL